MRQFIKNQLDKIYNVLFLETNIFRTFAVAYFIIVVSALSAIGFVVWHFIAKYW